MHKKRLPSKLKMPGMVQGVYLNDLPGFQHIVCAHTLMALRGTQNELRTSYNKECSPIKRATRLGVTGP